MGATYQVFYEDGTSATRIAKATCYSTLFFSNIHQKNISHIIDERPGILPEWAEFVINDERWSKFFPNKDVEYQIKNGFHVDADHNPVHFNWAISSLRAGEEHRRTIEPLYNKLKIEIPDIRMFEIYVLAHYIIYNEQNDDWSTESVARGHWYMNGITKEILTNKISWPESDNFSVGARMRHGQLYNSLGFVFDLKYKIPVISERRADPIFKVTYRTEKGKLEELIEAVKKNINWIRSYE